MQVRYDGETGVHDKRRWGVKAMASRQPRSAHAATTSRCAIERALSLVGDRWSLLILREAHSGVTRFAGMQASLGIAANMLSSRLDKLVEGGVLERADYRQPGQRSRPEYRLTASGRDLCVVLGALQQWGEVHMPPPGGPKVQRCERVSQKPVGVAFVNQAGMALQNDAVRLDGPLPPRSGEQ
jgi:DNA-binding HxlR family transcriptional regulator